MRFLKLGSIDLEIDASLFLRFINIYYRFKNRLIYKTILAENVNY